MGKKYTYLYLFIIVFLAFFLRIYLLGTVPPGLTNDEADIGYDAYSILLTGKDQWGKFIPLTSFKGFGDYRLPLYTYLVVPAEKIYGVTPFSVRLPSAVSGTLSVVLIYFLTKKLFEKKEKDKEIAALAAAAFMTVSPWAVGLSRIGIESNVAITLLLAAILVFLYGLVRPRLLFLSSLLFILTLYAYTSYTFFTPFVILVLCLFFKKQLLKTKKITFFAVVLFFLLIIPLVIFHSTAGVRISQVSFINSQDNIGLLANLNDRRGSCGEKFPTVICKITENKQLVFENTFMKNYLNHFSFNFLFLNGTTTQFSILPARSLFYSFELIIFFAGVIGIFKKKVRNGYIILLLLLISPIPDSITGEGHFSRASVMMPFVFILEGFGLLYLYNFISSFKKFIPFILKSIIFLLISFSIVSFFISYFSYFPKYYSGYSQYGYEQWANKLFEKKGSYQKIFLSKYGNDTKQYIYYLFYTKYNPDRFQKKTDVSFSNGKDGWISIDRINNLYFMEALPTKTQIPIYYGQKILLVSHPKEFPMGFELRDQIKDLNGNGVFAFVDVQQLLRYIRNHPIIKY